jgi:hypothetical protein
MVDFNIENAAKDFLSIRYAKGSYHNQLNDYVIYQPLNFDVDAPRSSRGVEAMKKVGLSVKGIAMGAAGSGIMLGSSLIKLTGLGIILIGAGVTNIGALVKPKLGAKVALVFHKTGMFIRKDGKAVLKLDAAFPRFFAKWLLQESYSSYCKVRERPNIPNIFINYNEELNKIQEFARRKDG